MISKDGIEAAYIINQLKLAHREAELRKFLALIKRQSVAAPQTQRTGILGQAQTVTPGLNINNLQVQTFQLCRFVAVSPFCRDHLQPFFVYS